MSKVNPFLMLGLNETVLGSVSDEDILALAQSQYRALSRIFHPDVGGNATVFAMISEAYESIQDEVARKEYLDDFVSSRADQLVRTQRDLMDLEEKRLEDLAKVRSEHANFLEDFVRAQNSEESLPLNSGDVTLVIQDNISDLNMYNGMDSDKLSSEGYSILRRVNGVLTISSLVNTDFIELRPKAKYSNVMTYVRKKTKDYPYANTWYKPGLEPKSVQESRFAEIEEIIQKAKEAGKNLTAAEEIDLRSKADTPLFMLYAFEEVEAEISDFVLLGCLPDSLVRFREEDKTPSGFQKMIEAPAGAKQRQIIGRELSYDEFQQYLGEIVPSFAEGNYLVAARLQGKKLRFIIVGEILPHRSL
jgi:hypothetical protein